MNKNKNSILIFDLDGTLIDSRSDLTIAVNLMRKHYKMPPLSIDIVTSYIGNGAKKLVERSLKDTRSANIDEALHLLKQFYNEHMLDTTTLYYGVDTGLKKLYDNGYTLILLTNKPTKPAGDILCHFRIYELFSLVAGGDFGYPLKPAPDAVNDIVRRFNGSKEHTWIIGDNYTDLECGRKANIKRAYAAYGFGNPKNEQWDIKLSQFNDLVSVLTRNCHTGI